MMNVMKLTIAALPENVALSRVAVSAFIAHSDVTVEVLDDVKTAVSEAVTNCIVHGYNNNPEQMVYLEATLEENVLEIIVSDDGVGIVDLEEARQPLYSTRPEEERSGMGITIMESFMDSCEIVTILGQGTTVTMKKVLVSTKTVHN
ncbi:MAG: anti-sigma F factor [Bacilli bacterium]